MVIKFVDTDEDLLKFLLCSRDFNEVLLDQVYKQALLRSSQHRLKRKRKILWLKILKIDENLIRDEYLRYYEKSIREISKNVEDTIDVDVARSFNNMK